MNGVSSWPRERKQAICDVNKPYLASIRRSMPPEKAPICWLLNFHSYISQSTVFVIRWQRNLFWQFIQRSGSKKTEINDSGIKIYHTAFWAFMKNRFREVNVQHWFSSQFHNRSDFIARTYIWENPKANSRKDVEFFSISLFESSKIR